MKALIGNLLYDTNAAAKIAVNTQSDGVRILYKTLNGRYFSFIRTASSERLEPCDEDAAKTFAVATLHTAAVLEYFPDIKEA